MGEFASYVANKQQAFSVGQASGQLIDHEDANAALRAEIEELKAAGKGLRGRVGLGGTSPKGDGPGGPDGPADPPTPGGAPGDDKGEGDDGDVDDERTLWVDIDEHNEQWKPWRNVCRESFTRGWGSEWDLDGPPSVIEVARHFDKNGGDPRLWLQLFESDKGIKRTDRLHHELATLVDTLYYAGSVDQLNIGGNLCLEIVARRLESIVEALRDGQDQANWDTAKYLSGRRSAIDCVSSGLRSWASSQVQNEMRVQSYRTRARGLSNRGNDAADDDGGDDGATLPDGGRAPGVPGKGSKRPKGRARGRGRGRM